MTFDLGMWPLTAWSFEGFHIISINYVEFQTDFSNETYFSFSAYRTLRLTLTLVSDPWPLNTWRFSCYIHKPSSIRLQLSKWDQFFTFNPSYNLTSDDFWFKYATFDLINKCKVPMLHLWPKFGWNPSKHQSLCGFPIKAGNTKNMADKFKPYSTNLVFWFSQALLFSLVSLVAVLVLWLVWM